MSALWPVALRSVRARPMRSLLTATAVALGVAVIVGIQITLSGLDAQAHRGAATQAGSSGLDVRTPGDLGLTDIQVSVLGRIPGVAAVEAVHEKRVTARAAVDTPGVEAIVVSVSNRGTSGLRPINLIRGRLPSPGARDEVAVDSALGAALVDSARRRPLTLGDHVTLTTVTGPDVFRIVGITAGTSGGAAFSRSAVFVSDTTLLSNFSLGLRTPLVALQLKSGVDAGSAAAQVHATLGGTVSTNDPRSETARPLEQLRPMLLLITALSLMIGGGVTANSTSLSVLERRREIGLLRAAGAGSAQVYRIFMTEGVLCGAAGAVTGILLGILLGAVLISTQMTGTAGGGTPPSLAIDPTIVMLAVIMGLLAAFAGGSFPALTAARLSPLAAIRPAPNAGRERASLRPLAGASLLFATSIPLLMNSRGAVVAAGAAVMLAGCVASLPMIAPPAVAALSILVTPVLRQAPLAARNLTRRRNRTALTTGGLVVSVATAIAVSALTGGALDASDHWIGKLLVGDTVVHSGIAQPPAIAKEFTFERGVRDVSAIRYFSETVDRQVTGFAAIDPALYARHQGFDFVDGDRETALRILGTGPSILVPRDFATNHNLHVGDVVDAGSGSAAVHLVVVGTIEHSFPTADGREALLLAQSVAITNFGDTAGGFNDLQIVSDGTILPTLQATASRFGMQATSVDTIRESSHAAMRHVIGLMLALSAIAVGIAMLAVVNTLLVTVRQSTRELGLLRAVGMARRHALSLLLTEAALLAMTGAVIGVAAGCVLAFPMLKVSSSSGFAPDFAFPSETAAVTLVTVLAGTMLTALVPARRAAGASIVSTIRYE